MVRAQTLPFNSAIDVKVALENAAKQVSSCAASSGRGLKAWGAAMLDGNSDMSVDTINSICSSTMMWANAGTLSPKFEAASHLDLGTKLVAGAVVITMSILSLVVTEATGYPSAGWVADDRVGWAFNAILERASKKDCGGYFGDKACDELRGLASDKAVQAWAYDIVMQDVSKECKKCMATMAAQCEVMADNLSKEFQEIMDKTNLISSLFGNINGLYKADKFVSKETVDFLWNAYMFCKDELEKMLPGPSTPKPPSGARSNE